MNVSKELLAENPVYFDVQQKFVLLKFQLYQALKQTQMQIPLLIFSEKPLLEKGRVVNTPYSKGVLVLFDIVNALQGSEKKKEVISQNFKSFFCFYLIFQISNHFKKHL
jgi:hypothetical protein